MPSCTKCGVDNRETARFCDGCGAPLAADAVPPAAPSEPATLANGRYELRRLIGEGGKKRVYSAYDSLLDREVALALIKAEGLDADARARVLREAQAMGRLGAHPNVVTVFDLGEEHGQPYLVTELMAGGDLEGLIEREPTGRLSLARVLELGKGICKGLAFAHEQGLVHRDLKPGNVWLSGDGQPKIGDFGLALPLERSRLTQVGTIVGTVAYMPPEQALGGAVTEHADLYSLGALVYELLTRRPPFVGDDPVSVIYQHINTAPVAPSWHAPGCPRALEALVLRLLAKDPSERPRSAGDVLAALEAIDPAEALDRVEPASRDAHALDRLAGGVFVGRTQELGELKAALERALSGEGRLVSLAGEPGIGKTRTALELATYARLRGACVLWGRSYESEGAPPYWPWVQAVRSYVREHELEQLRSELGAGAAVIATVVPDVRQRLPDLEEAPTLEDAPQARFRLFDSFTFFLRNAARTQPLVLVLDDLHWADEGSLRLLEFVARELADLPLLLLATYRDADLSRRHPLSQTLGELTRERLVERVLLRGLSREDVGRFVEATAGLTPPDELVGVVYAQTEGNPLFLSEIVRLLVQEGELTPERLAAGDGWSVRIPEGVREVIGRRLDRLSERCNETLAIASVIGREFGLDQLERLVDDVSPERLLEVLEEALAARVIEELPRTPGRYQFTHALIRETLAQELSLTRTVRLHARIAEALEELYGAESDRHAAELARHFGEAESLLGPAKVVHYSLIAGEAALGAHAHEQALVYFERALAAKEGRPVDTETAALLFGLGRAQLATLSRYELEPALDSMRQAFDYYATAGDVSRAVAVAAHTVPFNIGLVYTDLAALIADALRLVPPDSHEAGRLLAVQGSFSGLGEAGYEEAQRAFRQALSIARRHEDPALERRTLANAAWIDVWHFHLQEGLAAALQAIELAGPAGDGQTEMNARRSAAWAMTARGDRGQLRSHSVRELSLAERLRDRWWLATASFDNARLAAYEGDWSSARTMTDVGSTVQPGDPRTLAIRALVEYELGDFVEGEARLERLSEVTRRVRPPGPIAEHVFEVAAIALTGRIAGVDERLEPAAASAETLLGLPRLTPALAMAATIGLALIAVQRGDAHEAERLYAAIEPQRGTACFIVPLVFDRLLGLLAVAFGRIDAALAHFSDALVLCDRAGYRPESAWAACDYADALLGRGRPGDRDQAVGLQDAALATARELEMRPLAERILSRREILKA